MKLITYIENEYEMNQFIELASQKEQCEIILSCSEISRFSRTKRDELVALVYLAGKFNLKAVLEWDVLSQEDKFQKQKEFIQALPLHEFKAIRVQDPGAVHFIKTNYSWLPVQLILENGNHNFPGLKKWSEYLGSQCERLILSNELSRERLKEYAQNLSVPLEVLAMGRILLFYTPRLLLSPLEKEKMQEDYIEASGTSEESPHSGFPLIENSHGTFMFNVKDLYLLDQIDELKEMGVGALRFDLRFDDTFSHLGDILRLCAGTAVESQLTLKKDHPRPYIKGFYNINKTDVIFTKLKNSRIQRQDKNYVGEIVDVEKDLQLAMMIKAKNFDMTLPLKLVTPEGKEKFVTLSWMKTAAGEQLLGSHKDDLVLIPYVNGVTVKTQVYLNPNT